MSGVKLELILKRKFSKQIVLTYLPSILLTVIASSTPSMSPWSEGQEGVPLVICLATLISQIVIMNNLLLTLPKTAYAKMIDIWVAFGQLVSFVAFGILYAKKVTRHRPHKSIKANQVS